MRTVPSSTHRGDNIRDQLFVRVFTAARVMIDSTWNSRDVCSGYWRLYWNEAAGASIELPGGVRHVLPARRVNLIPAWVRFSCRNTRPLMHHYVHFDLVGVAASTTRRLFTTPLALRPDVHVESLARAIGAPAAAAAAACRAKAAVFASLAMVLDTLRADEALLLTAPTPVAPALRHIDDQLGAAHRNRELAARCHLSEDHFVRVFRGLVGRTPAQYILERRIAAATQDLAFTADSIEQIAERLGFANRYHLTRMFTRHMGIPPAAYRRARHV